MMPTAPGTPAERANAAIRDHLRSLPAHRPVTEVGRTEYERLVGKRLKAVGGVVLAA